jgi:hypothetical protein
MIMFVSDLPPAIPAIYSPATTKSWRPQSPLLIVGSAGTGGVEGRQFSKSSCNGYLPRCITIKDTTLPEAGFAGLMKDIQIGFERVMSHLPAIFDVSRQTLYNWRKGEIPKEKHQEKIRQLAKAALVFTKAGFKPTSTMLDRTVANGQSFIDLLKHNADGVNSAQKLMQIVNGGAQERAKLGQILGNRKLKPLNALDIGRPSLDERA